MKPNDSTVSRTLDGGEAIVAALRALDVDYVFTSPGSEWGSVWEAFARQQVEKIPGPTFVSCWHETLAVNLATGYSALTGRMQAVLLHAGVGLMQGSMGIHGARLAGTPLIIMSGESSTYGNQPGLNPGSQWYSGHNYVGGMQRVLEPLVKWAGQVTSPYTLYDLVTRAGELARSSPKGPTYLDVPIENMLHPWTPPEGFRKVPVARKPQPAPADIAEIAGRILAARNPVIVTSSAGRTAAGHEALLALAESFALPVVETSVAEVSNFPTDHPLHQGFDVDPWLEQADLMLLVKSKAPWYPPHRKPKDAHVVVIDDQPFNPYMGFQSLHADTLLEGDTPAALALLAEAIRAAKPDAAAMAERRSRHAASHDRIREGFRAEEAKAREKSQGIHPYTLARTLAEVLPADAIYVDETTTHRGANQRHVGYRGVHGYFRVSGGLGQGLGVSLGMKLADPKRMVVPLLGDGALLYNPATQALGFAKNARLPLLVVVYNNDGYRGMRGNHLSYYPQGVAAKHRIFLGETIEGPDYEELVRPFGGFGLRVDKLADLKPAIERAAAAVKEGKTAILNVIVD